MREQLTASSPTSTSSRALDTDGVEPTSHAVPLVNVMRDDEVAPCLAREAALPTRRIRSGEFFRVPRIIEE